MGLYNSPEPVYITISSGKFVRTFRDQVPGSVRRENMMGKTVFEELYNTLDGFIKDIRIKNVTAGGRDFKVWEVDLHDGGKSVLKLQINYSCGYSKTFLKKLPNIDFSEKVILKPTYKKINDKAETSLLVEQKRAQVLQYFKKERPNGLPPLKEIMVKGLKQWDDTEQMSFFEAMVKTKILPKISAEFEIEEKAVEPAENYEPNEDIELTPEDEKTVNDITQELKDEENVDDLPF